MKKIIISFFSIVFVVSVIATFNSCELKKTDYFTSNVKTGGLLFPQSTFPYKLGETTNFTIRVNIPKGPGIESIEVSRTYTDIDIVVVDQTIDVNSANENDDAYIDIDYDYAALISGLTGMPADDNELNIGDSWTLTYVAIMEDGRRVICASATSIGVANFFAGTYDSEVNYHHPSRGAYPDNGAISNFEKNLLAINANTCQTVFAVWSNLCWITINEDNSIGYIVADDWGYDVTLGVPGYPELVSFYDPITRNIQLYYNYSGPTGYRIFHELFTPAE